MCYLNVTEIFIVFRDRPAVTIKMLFERHSKLAGEVTLRGLKVNILTLVEIKGHQKYIFLDRTFEYSLYSVVNDCFEVVVSVA
jgi:hypothetical protein